MNKIISQTEANLMAIKKVDPSFELCDDIINLFFDYFTEIDGELISIDDIISYLTNVKNKIEQIPSLRLMLINYEKAVIGFIFGNIDYIFQNEKCGYILELFLKKEYRQNGYARKLVYAFEKECSNNIDFYKKIGYKTFDIFSKENNQKIFKKEKKQKITHLRHVKMLKVGFFYTLLTNHIFNPTFSLNFDFSHT